MDAEFWERYGIQILPSEPSLIRKSFESSKPLSFKNPRTVIGFNKSVDDELSLSKLTTLLIVPIPSTSLIIVLYNTSISNQFGSKNIFSMSLFAKSILPLFYQSPLNKSMENDDDIEMKNKIIVAHDSNVEYIGKYLSINVANYHDDDLVKVNVSINNEFIIKVDVEVAGDQLNSGTVRRDGM